MKRVAFILILVSCFACKTTREATRIDERAKLETMRNESRQKETSSTASGSFSQTTEAETNKETRLSGGSLHLSPPDSTGKQFPTVISWYGSNTTETSKITRETIANIEERLNSIESRFLSIEEELQTKTESETVSKTGFTFFEKTGLATLLLLIIVYAVIKWCLKIKK